MLQHAAQKLMQRLQHFRLSTLRLTRNYPKSFTDIGLNDTRDRSFRREIMETDQQRIMSQPSGNRCRTVFIHLKSENVRAFTYGPHRFGRAVLVNKKHGHGGEHTLLIFYGVEIPRPDRAYSTPEPIKSTCVYRSARPG